MALAAEESAKSKAAKEVIKSLTAQVKFLVNFLFLELDFSKFYFHVSLVIYVCTL